jgi:ectoine hydroxylase-related dioxygenase (phytanoyl-CoA dioxygenase family)
MSTVAAAGLTPAQRFRLDAFGYVLLEGVLAEGEVARMKAALRRMKADPALAAKRIYVNRREEHHAHFGHVVEYDPALLEYAVHPLLIPLVEELVGGAVRLEETEAIINRRAPGPAWGERRAFPSGFHRGAAPSWGTYVEAGNFHCLFVKTLAYLTDVGPEDGGTAVIPGSHKLAWREAAMIEAAAADPRLVDQVTARAGDVLLFAESLIHSTTEIASDAERMVLISGYTPTMMREWTGNEISPEFLAALPDAVRPILSGEANWDWKRRY